MIRDLWRAIADARAWLTLIVLGTVAAWLYVDRQHVRADRARLLGENETLLASAEALCAATGKPFAGRTVQLRDTAGRARNVTFARGDECRQAVIALRTFRADVDRANAQALADAMRNRDTKAAADAAAARRATERLAAATHRMEIADAEAERLNRVDRGWWTALNDLAGVRPAGR